MDRLYYEKESAELSALIRSGYATELEKCALELVLGLLAANEHVSTMEFAEAEEAKASVRAKYRAAHPEEFAAAEQTLAEREQEERRLCEAWEAENGAPERNRYGQIMGGVHPALNPYRYVEALRNRERQA